MSEYKELKSIFETRKNAKRFYRTAYETEVINWIKKKYWFRKNSSVTDILFYLEKIDGNNNNDWLQPLQ